MLNNLLSRTSTLSMSKKNIIVLAVSFLAVAATYFYLYKDSFQKEHIQISHTIRPSTWALTHPNNSDQPTRLVSFGFEHSYKLTSVKVMVVADLETNKYAQPIWDLISESNSVPMKGIVYGMHIRGMHPSVKGAQPGELASNVPYRLIVQAGSITGEHDFTLTDNAPQQ